VYQVHSSDSIRESRRDSGQHHVIDAYTVGIHFDGERTVAGREQHRTAGRDGRERQQCG
jgi:hypothetical protein